MKRSKRDFAKKVLTGILSLIAAIMIWNWIVAPAMASAYTVHVRQIPRSALGAAVHPKIDVHPKMYRFRNTEANYPLKCFVGFEEKVAPGPGTGGINKWGIVAYSRYATEGSKHIFRKACGGSNQKIQSVLYTMFINTENGPHWNWGPWATFWGWLPYAPDNKGADREFDAYLPTPVGTALEKAWDRYLG